MRRISENVLGITCAVTNIKCMLELSMMRKEEQRVVGEKKHPVQCSGSS